MPNSVGAYTTIRGLITALALIAAISPFGVTLLSPVARAQTQAVAPDGGAKFSNQQLDELVGPIALYPDELLAIVLPASTFPLEIVQAARYLEKRKSEPKLEPSESWDSSVLGLLNYPEVVEAMNQDLDTTSRLGGAVINQQQDVMDAIQRFRTQANSAGNLKSGEHTTIIKEKEIIKIESATPEVIYVPTYDPTVVVVQQPAPYPYAYSSPYPYYHSPAATFWTGMFVGAAIGYGIGWNGHGHNDININQNFSQNVNRGSGNKWTPNSRPGGQVGRPGTRPNTRPGSRPSTGVRTGGRSGAGTRPAGQTRRDASTQRGQQRRSTAGGGGQVRGQQGRGGQFRQQQGRGGAFGNYQNGRSARTQSNRGQRSRASQSTNRTSKASAGRSGGGRSGGGRSGSGGGRGGRR